jgi:putative addiction module component (TIGR02574 family)
MSALAQFKRAAKALSSDEKEQLLWFFAVDRFETAIASKVPKSVSALARAAFELPPKDRQRISETLVEDLTRFPLDDDTLREIRRRMDDLESGRVRGLTEEEFRAALR